MTIEQKKHLEDFKCVLYMMYGNTDIIEVVTDNKVLLKLKNSDTSFLYDLHSGNNKGLIIKDMTKLPLSKNYLILEESLDGNNCFIKILSKDTLDIIEEHKFELSDRYKNLIRSNYDDIMYNKHYNISEKYGYIGITLPTNDKRELNIHGKHIELDCTFFKIKENVFMSQLQNNIRFFNNIEDMNITLNKKLETFNNKVDYHPIFNDGSFQTRLPQVIFIHIKTSDKIYAYSLDDKQIHIVKDNRYKITIQDFINKLEKCLETSDNDREFIYTDEYKVFKGDLEEQKSCEKLQFCIDCNSLKNLNENKFRMNKIETENGVYLTIRTVEQCVNEYQLEFNGELQWVKQVIENNRLKESDKEITLIKTPYKAKSLALIEDIKKLQDICKLSRLVVTEDTLTLNELIKIENLHK